MLHTRATCAVIALLMLFGPGPLPAQQESNLAGKKAGEVREFGTTPKLKLAWCPAGNFVMGDVGGRHFDVQLTQGFWIGQTEVTQAQWTAVMKTRPWTPADNPDPGKIFGVKEGAKYPASYVSWSDANRFCVRLSDQLNASGELPDGWQFRLPTEAQWEYACRAGGEHNLYPGRSTDDSISLLDFAWFEWNSGRSVADADQHPREVALKKRNVWNLYDTSGNLEEWVLDGSPVFYGRRFVGGKDPYVISTGQFRVTRGGCYLTPQNDCEVISGHSRHSFYDKLSTTGFRVVLMKQPAK